MRQEKITVYQLDKDNIYTGGFRTVSGGEGTALGWTRTKPPEKEGKHQLTSRGGG